MKKVLLILLILFTFFISSCNNTTSGKEPIQIEAPVVTISKDGLASWSKSEGVEMFVVKVNDVEKTLNVVSYQLRNGETISVKALAKNASYVSSEFSSPQTYQRTFYTVTFMADGELVEKVTFFENEFDIVEPTVPPKSGYTAHWEEYFISNTNITVNAVYTWILVELKTPVVTIDENGLATWDKVDHATSYEVVVDGTSHNQNELSYQLSSKSSIQVKAVADGRIYKDSAFSEEETFKLSWAVTFMAKGEVYRVETYYDGDTSVYEHVPPHIGGYIGSWEPYELGNSDIIVRAVYTRITVNIATPTLKKVRNDLVTWNEIEHATKYLLLVNDKEIYTTELSYVPTESATIKVKAIGDNDMFLDSEYSNEVSVTIYYQLTNPDVSLDVENERITWKAITGADYYDIIVNDLSPVTTTNTYYDVTPGSKVQVRANSNNIYYIPSDYMTVKYYFSAEYNIIQAYSSMLEEDITGDFNYYRITFNYDGSMNVFISKGSQIKRHESTYEYTQTRIKETYNGEVITYFIDGDELSVNIIEFGDEISLTLKLKVDDPTENAVEFDSLLFGEDISQTKIYNYCPAIIYDTEDGKDIMHVWYCCNKDSGVIMDYIGYRKGVKQENGKWLFSEEQIVIEPTSDTWDARHTCDPAVIKGEFNYKGVKYSYLMAYLGCTTEDYQKNETGIAVSNNPVGPWVKIDEVNPIVPWYDNGDYATEEVKYQNMKGTSSIYWGTGMPSLVSIDGKGEVLLFVQSTLNGCSIRRIDLTDIEHPDGKWTRILSSSGVKNSNGYNCTIRIADFAFDPVNKRFYVTGVTNEKNPADITLTRVNSHSSVAYMENVNNMEEVASYFENGGYTWKMLGYIGPAETSWERNHNPGIVHDEYGYIPDSSKVMVIVSTGHNSWANENIFTYRLYGHTFEVLS